MAATARTATTLTHTTPVTPPASPGVAADNVNGDTFPNGGHTMLIMNNTAGSSATVTVSFANTVDGQAVTARQYTIPATTVQIVKLGPSTYYGDPVTVTASASTVKFLAYTI